MTETVLDALRRRKRSGPPFDDGHRIALVAEGGAMRGVFAGGMVSAIEAEGFTNCFDLYVGTSAGACALAYLRAGQARFGTRMFYEDLNTGIFIKASRVFSGLPAISIDYLVDDVFAGIKRLDLEALAAPGPELHATASDPTAAELVDLTGFDDPARALEMLRATARMPLLSGGPVMLDGRPLYDGGLLSHVPLGLAQKLGATHALMILTRNGQHKGAQKSPLGDRLIGYPVLGRRYGKPLVDAMRAERQTYARLYAALSPGDEIEMEGTRVIACQPDIDAPAVGRTTQDGALLRAAAAHAEERMTLLLQG